jgi:hypothetical protein
MTTPASPLKLRPPKVGAKIDGPNGHNGHGSHNGGQGDVPQPEPEAAPPPTPSKRNSIWPFIMDVGVVTMLVSLIIFRSGPFVVLGAFVFVIALIGWIREARADFSKLSD